MLIDRQKAKKGFIERTVEEARNVPRTVVNDLLAADVLEELPEILEDEFVPSKTGKLLGEVLLSQGKIKSDDIERVLQFAAKKGLRFGDAAIRLKLISRLDLEHAIAEQFDYPYLAKGTGGYSAKLIAAYEPFSPKGDALRNLRTQLLLRWNNQGHQTLAVVGPHSDEGPSSVAANLAIVFSQLGQRTLLVDANLEHSRQSRLFNLGAGVGLSALLVGSASLESAVQRMPLFRRLSILPAGAAPPNPGDLFGRKEWSTLVAELRRTYDITIFDAPSSNAQSGIEVVARECHNVLVVLQKNRTHLADAQALMNAVRSAGAEVLGSVMTSL